MILKENMNSRQQIENADRIAIGLLMPEKLTNQICIRSDKALKKWYLLILLNGEYKSKENVDKCRLANMNIRRNC